MDGFGLPSASQTPPPPVSLGGCLVNEANSLLRGLNVTSERRMDYIRRQTNRTVFYCRVYGARKVGKVSSTSRRKFLSMGKRGKFDESRGLHIRATSFHSAKRFLAQDERLARLHLPPAIVVRLHVRKSNIVILTPETVALCWCLSSSLSLSVGFPIQDEAMDDARSAPQGTHYHADVIYLIP